MLQARFAYPENGGKEVIATLADGRLMIIDAEERTEVGSYAATTTAEAEAILKGKNVEGRVKWAEGSPDFAQPQRPAGVDTGANGGE